MSNLHDVLHAAKKFGYYEIRVDSLGQIEVSFDHGSPLLGTLDKLDDLIRELDERGKFIPISMGEIVIAIDNMKADISGYTGVHSTMLNRQHESLDILRSRVKATIGG